jgi:hypothetical protein
MLKEEELQCLLDERADCVHVGFVYSLPELYNMNSEIKAATRSTYVFLSLYPSLAYYQKLFQNSE